MSKGQTFVQCPDCSSNMSVEVHNTSPQKTAEPTHVRIHSDSVFPITTPMKLRGSAVQTSVTPSSVPPRSPQDGKSKSDFHFDSAPDEIQMSDSKKDDDPETSADKSDSKEFTFPIALQQPSSSGGANTQSRGQFGGFVSRRGGRTGSPVRLKNEEEPPLPILQAESSSSPENTTQPLQTNVDTPSLISFASDGSPLKCSRSSKLEKQCEEVAPSNIFSSSEQPPEEDNDCKERVRSPPPMVCFADDSAGGGGGHNRYLSGVPLEDFKFTSPCPFSPFLNVTDSPMPPTNTPIAGKSCLKSPKANPRTPTYNGLLNGSFDTPNAARCLDTPGAFSWLQSPADMCESTPVSHFYKEVNGGVEDNTKESISTSQQFSQICISPLASSRRSNLYNAGHTLALLRSPKSPRPASFNAHAGSFEDDDLSILSHIADPHIQGGVWRSPAVQRDVQKLTATDAQKSSLQLPVMSSSNSSSRSLARSKPAKNAPHQYQEPPFGKPGVKGPHPPPGKLSGRGPPAKSSFSTKNAKPNNSHYLMPQRPQGGQYPQNVPSSMLPRGPNSMPPIAFPQFPHPGHPGSNPKSSSQLYSEQPSAPMFPAIEPTNPTKKRSSPKKERKSPPGSAKKQKMSSPPVDDKAKAAAADLAAAKAGTSTESAAALAAAIMRGVTMRPSGKWQAQLYYAGKSRYIGVFDSREKAALAYEIAREQLKADPKETSNQDSETTEAKVNQARKAAFEGVSEPDPKQGKKK